MANSILTASQITREAVRLFTNTNAFLQNVDKQYDDSFGKTGAKIGSQLRVRLPNDYTVRTGATASPQDTVEQQTTLNVTSQKGIDVQFSSFDRALSLDDFSTRVLKPMINNLAGAVAADLMAAAEGQVCNYVSNVDGSNNTLSPTANEWLLSGALLDRNSAPRGDRKIVLDALTQARTVSSLSGLFNPTKRISDQFENGSMGYALGYDWMMDQTTLVHTTGTFSAGTVSGAGQTGSTLTTAAITGTLKKGDIITVAGVNAVNRVTKADAGALRQFAVTADVASGATSIPVYPAIVVAPNQYATVTASPANAAVISLAHKASEQTRKNIAFIPGAVTFATADLELPGGVHEAARASLNGVSMRMVSQYSATTDFFISRLDIVYGYAWLRPEWACVVADKL